jgi:protein phosphatase
MKLQSFGISDLGNKRRNNEDRFLRDDRRGIYIVCDGMGGAAAGEVASGNSAAMVYSTLMGQPGLMEAFRKGGVQSGEMMVEAMRGAILEANRKVFEHGVQHPERKGMGSTLTALCIGGDTAVVGHVGDSRVYQWHGNAIRVLTEDHSWVSHQVKMGKMTEAEAKVSKKRNLILRVVGIHPEVQPDVLMVPVFEGDRFMLCSDGLHGYLTSDTEAAALVGTNEPVQRRVMECIALARQRGGKDNVTTVMVDVVPG